MTTDIEQLKADIHQAFALVERPFALRGSDEGEEPYLLETDFRDKTDWRSLDPAFLDQAPGGFASALSFFSDEAFRYFLSAYLIADRRYGTRTWMDAMQHKFSMFSAEQARVIVRYLQHRAAADEYERPKIEQAIFNYWRARSA